MAHNLRTKAGRAEAAAQLRSQRLQALRYHPDLAAFSDEELDWIITTVEAPDTGCIGSRMLATLQ